MMKVFFVLLVCAVAVCPTLTAPLPQQQTNNDPFSNLSRAFNQMAANTFGTAASQHRQHSQQAQRPGVRPVIDRSSVSSGHGHQFASSSVHSTGTGVSATAHASSSSHGTNQRKQKPNRASSTASQSSTSTRQGNRNQNRRTENTHN